MDEIVGNVTCPLCKYKQAIVIPTKSCQTFYKCNKCERTIQAKKSCCVFCDYGDRKCPAAEKHNINKLPTKSELRGIEPIKE